MGGLRCAGLRPAHGFALNTEARRAHATALRGDPSQQLGRAALSRSLHLRLLMAAMGISTVNRRPATRRSVQRILFLYPVPAGYCSLLSGDGQWGRGPRGPRPTCISMHTRKINALAVAWQTGETTLRLATGQLPCRPLHVIVCRNVFGASEATRTGELATAVAASRTPGNRCSL